MGELLAVKNGDEAINLFVESDRVYQDLINDLKFFHVDQNNHLNNKIDNNNNNKIENNLNNISNNNKDLNNEDDHKIEINNDDNNLNKIDKIIKKEGKEWGVKVIIRKWDEKTTLEFEFRVFVFMRKVTGISQYNLDIFYPNLQGKEEEIKKKIVDHHLSISDQIPFENYVIDYLLVGDYLRVIELNPFVRILFYFCYLLIILN